MKEWFAPKFTILKSATDVFKIKVNLKAELFRLVARFRASVYPCCEINLEAPT